jgi:ADP-heptose:LPS heptosyltransferase
MCAVPALRAMKSARSDCRFELVGLPFVRPLVDRSPWIDELIEFPGFPGIAEQFFDARRFAAWIVSMQERRFDLAVQIYGSGVYANPAALLMGARFTAGFVRPGDGPGRLDLGVPMPGAGHHVDRALELAVVLGAESRGRHLEFPVWREDVCAAQALLAGLPRPVVAIHSGARDAPRVWRSADAVAAGLEVEGATVLRVGTEPGCVRTSLPALGALLAACDLFITTDSGPAHIAYAVGARSITLFPIGDPAVTGPVEPLPRHGIVRSGDADQILAEARRRLTR